MNYWDRYRDIRIVYRAGLRATKYGVSGSFTLDEWLDLCAKHENKCAHCKALKPLAADHIIPLSKGGTNNIDNIQPLCLSCNSRKKDKLPEKGTGQEHIASLVDRLQRFVSHARHRLIIDLEQARKLAILARQSDIGVDQFVEDLIEQAWQQAIEDEQAS